MQKLPCQSSGQTEWSARVAQHRRVRALRGESSTGLAVAARVAARELGNDRVSKRKKGLRVDPPSRITARRGKLRGQRTESENVERREPNAEGRMRGKRRQPVAG